MTVTSNSPWHALEYELDAWIAEGKTASMWWRDDDAITRTKGLEWLYALSDTHDIPLCLAVIPKDVNDTIYQGAPRYLAILQHGYAHVNHATAGNKKSEFGDNRQIADAQADIESGYNRLSGMPAFVAAFVPPWNRIAAQTCTLLQSTGLVGLSTYAARSSAMTPEGLKQVNTHVDIIDWRGNRDFVGVETVCGQIVRHLNDRRNRKSDLDEPTGLLTHHLVHTPSCWSFLGDLFQFLKSNTAVRWHSGQEIFAV